MPNQPAKDSKGIYIRVHDSIKAAIQEDIDRLNTENPGAGYTISSWIRGAIEEKLKTAKKKNK